MGLERQYGRRDVMWKGSIGHFEFTLKTASELYRIALWDFRAEFWPSSPRSLVAANQISRRSQNSPMVQFATTPTRSHGQPRSG